MSETPEDELVNAMLPATELLPTVFPVTFPIFAEPAETNIPVNGLDVVPEIGPETDKAVMTLP